MKREQMFRTNMKEDIALHSPGINKSAQKLKRGASVEDGLMKRNEEYKANLEARRREKEVYEVGDAPLLAAFLLVLVVPRPATNVRDPVRDRRRCPPCGAHASTSPAGT